MIITNNFLTKVSLTFVLINLILISSFAQEGTCSSLNTSFNSFATAADANTAASSTTGLTNLQTLTTKEGPNTLVTLYYSVTSSAGGSLGFLMTVYNDCLFGSTFNQATNNCDNADGSSTNKTQIDNCGTTIRTSRDCKLFPVASACSGTGNIPYDTKIKNSTYSTTFNPEWTSLTPSTNYVLVITMNLSTLCSTPKVGLSKYDPPVSSCPSTIGTVAVTGATANGSEWDVKAGATLNLTASGYTLPPSSASPCAATYGYIIFNQAPTLPITDVTNLSSLPGYQTITTGAVCTDNNKAGSSSSLIGKNKLWFVPFTADCKVAGDPVVFDDNTDLCYKIGTTSIVVNYLPPVPCGTCATPNCPIGNLPTYLDRFPASGTGCSASTTTNCPGKGAQVCQTGLSMKGTEITYQTVTADGLGNIGALVQSVGISTLGTYTITSDLYEVTDCNGVAKTKGKFSTDGAATGTTALNVHNRGTTNGSWNPEWTGLVPGKSYILKTTFNVASGHEITEYCMDFYGLKPIPICKTVDFEVQKAGVKVTNFNFTCSDNIVDLVALDPPDITLPEQWIYPGFILYIKPQSGTTWASVNKIDLIFNGVSSGQPADVLADLQNVSLTNTDPYIFPVPFAQPGTFAFEIIGLTTNSTKKFDYILFNAADGTVADQGTLDKTKMVTLTKNPVGTAHFSGPGVTDDPNNGGKGFFDPKVAGTGTHTITYTWDNGTNGAIHCTGTKTLSVTVTGGPTISTTPIEVCKGITTSTIPFTSTGSPTQYILTWDATAKSAGFSDITTYTTLSASPLSIINIPALAAIDTYIGTITVKNAGGCITTSPISVKIKDCCSAAIGTFKVTLDGTVVTGNNFDLAKGQTLVLTSNNDFVLPPQSSTDAAGVGYAVFTCDPSTLDLTNLANYSATNCFEGYHYSKDFTDKNDGTSTNSGGVQLGVTTFWMVPITFDDICSAAKATATCKTGNTDIGVDINADGCFKVGTPLQINYIKIPCGTCATPNCPIGSVPNYKDRLPATATCNPGPITTCPGQGETVCNTGVNFTDIEITYQTVVADAKGKLGAYIQGADYSGSTGFTITSRLFSQANCGVIPIPTSLFGTGNGTTTPTNDNVYGRGPTNGSWNPEWSGLTPNGTYILETTFNLGTEILKSYCMDFYGSTNCPAKIGTISVTGTGVTPKGINEYDVDPGSTITITSTNYVLPTPTSHVYSYAFFWCDPGTLTAAELLNLKDQPCYIASDNNITISDVNNAGESTSIPGEKVLWVVPFTRLPDTSSPPKVIVNDGTDCYAIGSPIKITYLKPPCGTCATPNCPIGSVPTYRDRLPASATCTPTTANSYTSCPGQGGTICNTGVNFTGTEISYQTVIADAKGKLGAYIQGADFTGTSGYTVTSRLFATGNCGVAAIPTSLFGSGNGTVTPTNNNVYGRGPTNGSWNPEWTGLTPNGTYILETTFNLGTEILRTYCMDYYGSPTCPEIKNPIPAFSFCSGATPTNSLEVESPNKVKYFYSTTKLTDASGNLNSGVNLYSLATVSNTLGTSTTAGTKEKLILTSTSFPTNISSSSVDYYVYAIFNDITLLDVSCRDFEEIKVTVNTLPVLKINNPATVCIPLTVDITNPLITLGSTGNGILSYYSDASNISVLANPSKIAVAGTYYIKSSNGSCSDSKPVTVTFITSPSLIVTNPAEVCQPATIDITDPKLISGNSTGAVITYCSNSAGTTLLTSPNSIRNSGTYYVKSTEFGCSTIMPIIVKVNPKPKANFVPTPPNVTTINSKSIMLNTSLNAVEYSWIFSDGLVSSDVSPEHNFPNKEQSKQVIILIATSDAGCMDTTSKIINVNEEVIYYIPNSFTPDGDDFNQVFKPVFTSGFDPFTYHLSIFNRWGELVFESNDTEVGWAGLYGKDGVLVQEGSFTWKIDFKLKENDARKILVGNVNILK